MDKINPNEIFDILHELPTPTDEQAAEYRHYNPFDTGDVVRGPLGILGEVTSVNDRSYVTVWFPQLLASQQYQEMAVEHLTLVERLVAEHKIHVCAHEASYTPGYAPCITGEHLKVGDRVHLQEHKLYAYRHGLCAQQFGEVVELAGKTTTSIKLNKTVRIPMALVRFEEQPGNTPAYIHPERLESTNCELWVHAAKLMPVSGIKKETSL